MPPGDSLFHYLYSRYKVKMLSSSKPYTLGENVFSGYSINVPSDIKFDAVVLLNHYRPEEGMTYKASDIKRDFAHYCKPNFVLQDAYTPRGPLKVDNEQGWMESYRGITSDIPENAEGTRNFEKVVQSSLLSRGGDGAVSSTTLNQGRRVHDTEIDPEGNHTPERIRSGVVNPVIWDTVDSNGEKINVHDLFEKVGIEETFKIQHKTLSDLIDKNDWSDIIKIW